MIETRTIIDIFVRETSLDPATLTSETLIRELGLDSLGMMNVIFGIEDTTGVELQVEELGKVMTIGDLVGIIQIKVAALGAEA